MYVIMRKADTSTGVEYLKNDYESITEFMSEAKLFHSDTFANAQLDYMEGEGWIVFKVR